MVPLKLLETEQDIEYRGYTFYSTLPEHAIPAVFDYLRKAGHLLYDANDMRIGVTVLDDHITVGGIPFAVRIVKNTVMLTELDPTAEDPQE